MNAQQTFKVSGTDQLGTTYHADSNGLVMDENRMRRNAGDFFNRNQTPSDSQVHRMGNQERGRVVRRDMADSYTAEDLAAYMTYITGYEWKVTK